MKTMKNNVACLGLAMALTIAMNAGAADGKTTNPCFAVLSQATQVELPVKAAELISKATAKQRPQTTLDTVKAAVALNPAAAPAIIGSIAQAVPEMAPVAAATAASLVPDQAAVIARVAAAAAPAQAGQIVQAICRVLPKRYKEVANAVAEVVPSQKKEILTAVSTAIPALKAPLAKVLATYGADNAPAVGTVLDQVQPGVDLAATTSPSLNTQNSPELSGPSYGPPYVSTPPTHQNLDPGSGTSVPSGGRDYSGAPPPAP